MAAIFADRIKPVADNLETCLKYYKENPQVDVPILRERIHYSFIWDKYALTGLDDIDLKKEREKDIIDQEH